MPDSSKKSSTSSKNPNAWKWLQQADNQRTLRFVGAGLVAAVGVLVSLGFLHRSDSATDPKPSVGVTQSAPTEVKKPLAADEAPSAPDNGVQSAIANGSGNAANIHGSKNEITIQK